MNFQDLNNLDLRDINLANAGDCPLPARLVVMALSVIIWLAIGYFLVIRGKRHALNCAQQ